MRVVKVASYVMSRVIVVEQAASKERKRIK